MTSPFDVGPRAGPPVERIEALTREEVDDLPYGLMIFDHRGTVLLYNRYEARMSRRAPEEVVGQSWFDEVAPCTRVQAFRGRFEAFVARGALDEVLRFDFRFYFLHGAQDVAVQLTHAPGGAHVFVSVVRRALQDTGERLDVALPSTTSSDGRARGGLGSVLPAPRLFFAAAFDDVHDDASRARLARGGAAWGRALVEAVEASAEAAHGAPLTGLPPQLAVALLDTAFAAQGLGRLDVDFGGKELGVLGVVVRSADLPRDVAGALYQAILEEVCRALTGRDLAAVQFACLGDVLRFAVAPPEKTSTIARWRDDGMAHNAIAQRLGLEVWT